MNVKIICKKIVTIKDFYYINTFLKKCINKRWKTSKKCILQGSKNTIHKWWFHWSNESSYSLYLHSRSCSLYANIELEYGAPQGLEMSSNDFEHYELILHEGTCFIVLLCLGLTILLSVLQINILMEYNI